MKKNYYITLDVETVTTNRLIYDIGLAVHDKHGNIVERFSFVCYEIYTLFKNRIPEEREQYGYVRNLNEYERRLRNGETKMVKFSTILKVLAETIAKYDVKSICAYNGKFDKSAIERTADFLYGSLVNIGYGIEWYDTWEMAKNTLCKQKMYNTFCDTYGFKTKHKTPRNQTKAEVVYAYINGEPAYTENHIGIDDVEIEIEIFAKCLRQHKPMGNYRF